MGTCRSIYRWEGRIEEASEVAALFKTRAEVAERLMLRLQKLHSYDVPAIVVWPIADVPSAYARWVEDQTRG
jgi:periplasmic divalent cation tolerance protein